MEFSEQLLQLFRDKRAYLEGHFRLSSGLHSPNYMQCAKILQHPLIASDLGSRLARDFSGVDIVLSPAMGGIIIGHEVARALNVPFIFSEREENEVKLRRGFAIDPGQNVLVIEDVVTTGRSTKETIDVARQHNGIIAGVGSIVDRSNVAPEFHAPFHSLLRLPLVTYSPENCPLCAQNIPIVKPGSRKI